MTQRKFEPRIHTDETRTAERRERPKPQASKLRTAGILAGGFGLAYGGVRVGRAASALERTAQAGEAAARRSAAAAENMRAITQGIRKTGTVISAPFRGIGAAARKIGNVLRLRFSSSLRKDRVVAFSLGRTGVAQHRYQRQIKESDTERAASNYTRSAVAGAGLGLALRGRGMSMRRAGGMGMLGGLAAQGATRMATASTKDAFGDRSPRGKLVDSLAPSVIAAGALMATHSRVKRELGSARQAARKLGRRLLGGATRVARSVPGAAADVAKTALGFASQRPTSNFQRTTSKGMRVPLRASGLIKGTALAGGIAAADAVTSAAFPQRGESAAQGAKHGLAKGAVYGTALALGEPALSAALKKVARARRGKSFAARGRVVNFGGRQQLRDGDNRFVDPLEVAAGMKNAYHQDERGVQQPLNLPIGHAQVVRAALNKGQTLHRYGSRGAGLIRDAVGAARGEEKVDSRGRPQKREWEKSWFKRAAGSALIGAGLLGHAAVMKRNPGYRRKVQGTLGSAKRKVNQVIPDAFPGLAARPFGVIRFDVTAPDWDVRDQRGRSARVFAPGARPRDRREKKWHERVGNIRKAALIGALAAAAGGGAIGYRLGRRGQGSLPLKPASSNVVPFPARAS